MKLDTPAQSVNPHLLLTKAGYHAHPQGSYVMRLGSGHYPRFHVYVKTNKNKLTFNLHIDQKPGVHLGAKAHAGESDTPVVQEEAARLQRWIKYFTR